MNRQERRVLQQSYHRVSLCGELWEAVRLEDDEQWPGWRRSKIGDCAVVYWKGEDVKIDGAAPERHAEER